MKMFLGEYNPNITEGSRIALPKKLREQISNGEVILSKGFEKCIYIYDKPDWSTQVEKQVENMSGQMKRSDLERYIYTSAVEADVDSQGRVVLPQNLKSYAGISTKTAVIGVGDHVEVWDYETWTSHLDQVSQQLSA